MRLSRYTAALLVIAMLICNACTGGSPEELAASGPAAGPAGQEVALQQLGAILPQIPGDPYVDPAQIADRRGSIVGTLGLWGHELFDASAGVLIDEPQRTAGLVSGASEFAWAIYRFESLLDSDNPNLLTLTTDAAALPEELYVGWASYTRGHWLFDLIETPTGSDNLTTPFGEDLISDGGSLYVAVIVNDDDAATVEQLSLGLDTLAPPPTNISASRTVGRSVELAWDTPPFAHEGIRIERSFEPGGPFTVLVELSGAPGWYTDLHNAATNPIPYNEDVYYRFRTVTTVATGPPSITAIGRRLLPPATGLTATKGDHPDKVELGWDSHFEANTYHVYYKLSDQGDESWELLEELNGFGVTAYDHTSTSPIGKECANNQDYDYRVLALYDGDAALEYSNVDTGHRLFEGPVNVSAGDGADPNSIAVAWDAVADATGYEVYRDSQDTPLQVIGPITTYADTSATAVFPHTYWVRALNGADQSTFSDPDTGYRNNWLTYTLLPSANTNSIMSFGLISGRPGLAFYDQGMHDLRYAYSSALAPNGTAPWSFTDAHTEGESGWQPSLVGDQPRPVVFHRAATDSNLLYSRANTAVPEGTDDWFTMVVDEGSITSNSSPSAGQNVFGQPCVSYFESSTDALKFAWASTPEPTESSHWRTVVVDDVGITGYRSSLSMEFGTAAICYYDITNDSLKFAYTWDTDPQDPADWVVSVVDPSTNDTGKINDMLAIGETLYISYSDLTDSRIMVARSKTKWPEGVDDWERMVLSGAVFGYFDSSLGDINGVPAVCYTYSGDGPEQLIMAYATSAHPSAPEDWVKMTVYEGEHAGRSNRMLITEENVIIAWHEDSSGSDINISISQ